MAFTELGDIVRPLLHFTKSLVECANFGEVAASRLIVSSSSPSDKLLDYPDRVVHHVTPLNPVQQHILALLGFVPDLYSSLARTIPLVLPPTPFVLRG